MSSLLFAIALAVGAVTETITVTADSPLVDLGKIEQGRTLTEAEIKTLPLTSRNPYNFALAQPGVTGYENPEFGVPRLSANGTDGDLNFGGGAGGSLWITTTTLEGSGSITTNGGAGSTTYAGGGGGGGLVGGVNEVRTNS